MANDTPLDQFAPEDDIDVEWLALQREMAQAASPAPGIDPHRKELWYEKALAFDLWFP